MALRIWLPLNGTNINQGISGTTMSGSPNSWSAAGKIGKCAAFSNNAANVIYANVHDYDYTTEDFSWAMWLKKDKSAVTTSMYAFTVGRADAGGYGYGMQVNSSTQVSFKFGNASYGVSCPDNEWHHFAFTKQGTTICTYVDGALVGGKRTFSGSYPTYSDGNGIGIGCFHYSRNIYPLTGSVNDFRIYDHTLSPKEVYQLSKGLCLHYKLDDPYQSGMRNLYSGENAAGSNVNGSGSFTRTKLANEPGYNYKLTYTGTGGNSWKTIDLPGLSRTNFKPNTKYTWSCKIRINKWTGDTLSLRSAITRNDYTNGSIQVASTSKPVGVWTEYSRTITMKEGMHIASTAFYYITEEAYNASTEATKYYVTPRVEFYTGSCPTKDFVYEFDFDLKDLQLIEADEFPGFIDNTFASTVSDSTGIGNNAISVTGAFKATSGSPRYRFALTPNDGSHIKFHLPEQMEQATYSYWIKPTTAGYKAICYAAGSPTEGKHVWLSANTEGKGLWTYIAGASPNYHRCNAALSNEWHHCCWVFDKGASAWYLDGNHVGTDVTWSGLTAIANTRDLTIGDSYGGSSWGGTPMTDPISDFRIYATALTADDVKSLYNVGATMDDSGKLYCGELNEFGSRASAQKNTVFMSTGVNETRGKSFVYSSDSATATPADPTYTRSYTPTTASNSCIDGIYFKPDPAILSYHIEADIIYSNFAALEGQTFDIYFQGNNRKKANSSWPSPWEDTNYVCNALNAQMRPKTAVLSATAGKYHYSTSFTMAASWFDTFDMSAIGFRSNYSSGTGTISLKNVRIYPERDYKNRVCSINNDGSVSTRELDEALF